MMEDDETLPLKLMEDRNIQLILSTDTSYSDATNKADPKFDTHDGNGFNPTRQDDNEPSVALSSSGRDSMVLNESSNESEGVGFEVEIDKNILRLSNGSEDCSELQISLDDSEQDATTTSISMDKSVERRRRLTRLGKSSRSSGSSKVTQSPISSPRHARRERRRLTYSPSPKNQGEKQAFINTSPNERQRQKLFTFEKRIVMAAEPLNRVNDELVKISARSTMDRAPAAKMTLDEREDKDSGRSAEYIEPDSPIHVPKQRLPGPKPERAKAPLPDDIAFSLASQRSEYSTKASRIESHHHDSTNNTPSDDADLGSNTSSDIDGRLAKIKAAILENGSYAESTMESVEGRWEQLRNKLLTEESQVDIDGQQSNGADGPTSKQAKCLNSSKPKDANQGEELVGKKYDEVEKMFEEISYGLLEKVTEEERKTQLLATTTIARCRTDVSESAAPADHLRDLNRATSYGGMQNAVNVKTWSAGSPVPRETSRSSNINRISTQMLMVDLTPTSKVGPSQGEGGKAKEAYASIEQSSQPLETKSVHVDGNGCFSAASMSPLTVEGEENQKSNSRASSLEGISDEGLDENQKNIEEILASSCGTDDQDTKSTALPMLGNVLSSLSESCESSRFHEKCEKSKVPYLQNSVTGSTVLEEESASLTPTSNNTSTFSQKEAQEQSSERGPKIEVTLLPEETAGSPEDSSSKETMSSDSDPSNEIGEGFARGSNRSKKLCAVREVESYKDCTPKGSDDSLTTSSDESDDVVTQQDPEKDLDSAGETMECSANMGSVRSHPGMFHAGVSLLDVCASSTSSQNEQEDCSMAGGGGRAPTSYTVDFKAVGSFDASAPNSPSAETPSWQLEPDESLSDWKIQVQHLNSGVADTYNIHRHAIGVGPRKSEYLAKVFQAEGADAKRLTRIQLEDTAARLFPRLLDFIYSRHKEIEVTTKDALSLRHLAKTFEVRLLARKVTEFIQDDLAVSNMSVYLTNAASYKDKKILKLVADMCAEQIMEIEISHPLWAVMEPLMFLRVIGSHLIEDRLAVSPRLSLLVAEYQSLHKYEIGAEEFKDFTTEDIIPVIDRNAALLLLEISEEYGIEEHFIPLQKRCTLVLAHNWAVTSGLDRGRLFAVLRSLPSHFTVDFLELVETGKSATLLNALNRSHKESSNSEGNSSSRGGTSGSSYGSDDSSTIGVGYLNCPPSTEENEESELSWRLDPKKSFSDWVLEVKNLQYGEGVTYHVHKQVLGVGPRKSKFFKTLFKSQASRKMKSGKTTIALGYSAAALVPQVLDFVYSAQNELEIVSETAVTLRFLARYFQIMCLNEKILEFIRVDITLENVASYVSYCNTFNDVKVAEMAANLCGRRIQQIDEESDLLRELDANFFVRVVSSEVIDRAAASCHLSILIAKYHTIHKLDESVLESIVSESQLPEIDCKSALALLKIVDKLENNKSETFSKLRQRCMHVLESNWKIFREEHRDDIFSVFRNLDANLVTSLFDVVESEYHTQCYNMLNTQSKLVKRYRKQLADTQQQHLDEVTELNKEKDGIIAELMRQKAILEEQLKRHNDASNRRVGRSSSAYRSRIPSPGSSFLLSPRSSSSMKSAPPSPSTLSCIPTLNLVGSPSGSRMPSMPMPKTPPSYESSSPAHGSNSSEGSKTLTPKSSNSSRIASPKGKHASRIPTPKATTVSSTKKKPKEETSSFFGFTGFSEYLKSHASIARSGQYGKLKQTMTFG